MRKKIYNLIIINVFGVTSTRAIKTKKKKYGNYLMIRVLQIFFLRGNYIILKKLRKINILKKPKFHE